MMLLSFEQLCSVPKLVQKIKIAYYILISEEE